MEAWLCEWLCEAAIGVLGSARGWGVCICPSRLRTDSAPPRKVVSAAEYEATQ